MTLGVIWLNGGGTWTTIGPWTVGSGSSTTTLASIDGRASGGITLPAGIYKVRPSWVMRSGTQIGFVGWRLTGNGFSRFPEAATNIHPSQMPGEFYDPRDTYNYNRSVTRVNRVREWDSGYEMIVSPQEFTFGLQVGTNRAGCNLQFAMSIERII
jgi:hypothetical protein